MSLKELTAIPEEEWSDEFKALSSEDREKALADQFTILDTNEDGEITTEEVVELVKKEVQEIQDMMKELELAPSTESDDSAPDSVE